MGGRGASSGISVNGKKYGTEYEGLLKEGNIKFVRYRGSGSAKAPQETMTKGRVYATVNQLDKVVAITYFTNDGKRKKTIDLGRGHNKKVKGNHAHEGYYHEGDARNLTHQEKKLVDFVINAWNNRVR